MYFFMKNENRTVQEELIFTAIHLLKLAETLESKMTTFSNFNAFKKLELVVDNTKFEISDS